MKGWTHASPDEGLQRRLTDGCVGLGTEDCVWCMHFQSSVIPHALLRVCQNGCAISTGLMLSSSSELAHFVAAILRADRTGRLKQALCYSSYAPGPGVSPAGVQM